MRCISRHGSQRGVTEHALVTSDVRAQRGVTEHALVTSDVRAQRAVTEHALVTSDGGPNAVLRNMHWLRPMWGSQRIALGA